VISRFSLTDDPNIADANSEQIIKFIAQPYDTHNGGQIAFGPDGIFISASVMEDLQTIPSIMRRKQTLSLAKFKDRC